MHDQSLCYACCCWQDAERKFVAGLAAVLKAEVYLPAQFIVIAGYVSRSMYFIQRGRVQVIRKVKEEFFMQEVSDYFDVMGLFTDRQQQVSVRSLTHTDLYRLQRDSFDRIVKDYPAQGIAVANSARACFKPVLAEIAARRMYEVVGMPALIKRFWGDDEKGSKKRFDAKKIAIKIHQLHEKQTDEHLRLSCTRRIAQGPSTISPDDEKPEHGFTLDGRRISTADVGDAERVDVKSMEAARRQQLVGRPQRRGSVSACMRRGSVSACMASLHVPGHRALHVPGHRRPMTGASRTAITTGLMPAEAGSPATAPAPAPAAVAGAMAGAMESAGALPEGLGGKPLNRWQLTTARAMRDAATVPKTAAGAAVQATATTSTTKSPSGSMFRVLQSRPKATSGGTGGTPRSAATAHPVKEGGDGNKDQHVDQESNGLAAFFGGIGGMFNGPRDGSRDSECNATGGGTSGVRGGGHSQSKGVAACSLGDSTVIGDMLRQVLEQQALLQKQMKMVLANQRTALAPAPGTAMPSTSRARLATPPARASPPAAATAPAAAAVLARSDQTLCCTLEV